MIFHLPTMPREHPFFRNGRTHDEQQAIRLAIVAEGKDATRASVNRRLVSTGIVATEGEFLRIFALYFPDLGVPQLVDEDGNSTVRDGGPDQCRHCERPCFSWQKRGLCADCYKRTPIRKQYGPPIEPCKHCSMPRNASVRKRGLCDDCHANESIRKQHPTATEMRRAASTLPKCKHCRERLMARISHGLCDPCWRDKTIRVKYPTRRKLKSRQMLEIQEGAA